MLVYCPECLQYPVSLNAKTCPGCHAPLWKYQRHFEEQIEQQIEQQKRDLKAQQESDELLCWTLTISGIVILGLIIYGLSFNAPEDSIFYFLHSLVE